MNEKLQELDAIISRTGAGYALAAAALEQNDNDVVRAIVAIENGMELPGMLQNVGGWAKHKADRFCRDLEEMVCKSKDDRVQICKNGCQMADMPAPLAVAALAGMLFLPSMLRAASFGALAAMAAGMSLCVRTPQTEQPPAEQAADTALSAD